MSYKNDLKLEDLDGASAEVVLASFKLEKTSLGDAPTQTHIELTMQTTILDDKTVVKFFVYNRYGIVGGQIERICPVLSEAIMTYNRLVSLHS
jgi:hypothetical protein